MKKVKSVVIYALNPDKFLCENNSHKWHLYLILPAVGWMFFFMQVGLDRNALYYVPAGRIALISLLGLVLGYVTVGLIGTLINYILRQMKKDTRRDGVISCIAMSHTYMVFSLVMGFIYRLFGASSSAVFGLAGLLCTLLPIYSGIRNLGHQNAFFAPVMTTVIGVLLLAVWNVIMIIPL